MLHILYKHWHPKVLMHMYNISLIHSEARQAV